jgi:MFS transporter, DHA1 family, multidrug resistance protein
LGVGQPVIDAKRLAAAPLFRALLRTEIVAVCAVVFLADTVAGTLLATFALYAASLGASVALVGVLTSLTGLTSLISSLPIGIVSDRVGRTRVLFIGMSGMALAMLLFAAAPSAPLLVPGRLLFGVAMVATFWIAAAYLGDAVAGPARGVAFGLLTTAMGLGFTVGSLLGGEVAERFGMRAAYLLAAAIGAIGAVIVLAVLGIQSSRGSGAAPRTSLHASLGVARERPLLLAGAASILSALAFGGAVLTIFPLYAASLGLAAGTIGAMFALRAIASTIIRLPSGALIAAYGSGRVMLGALLVELIAVTGIGTASGYRPLLFWLALEGLAYGAFLTSSQAYVAEHSVESSRGAAIGFYAMTGGIGNTLAPLLLGVLASVFGLGVVFFVTGGVGLGMLAVLGLVRWQVSWGDRRLPRTAPAEIGQRDEL